MIVTTMPTSTLLSSTSILPSPSSSSSSSSCSTSSYLSLGAYNQFTESMHTLSDIDDMVNGLVGNSSVGQHNNNNNNGQSGHQQSYCDDNGDYGLEGPTGPHASYLDNGSEFYPSVVGSTMVSDSKYTSDYITASKSSYTEVINSRGRYSDNLTSLDLMNSYGSHQYDNSFQTVPSPIPTTPSPEQWASELSPHSSSVSNRFSSSTNNLNNSSSNANTSVNNCVNSSNSCNYSKSTSNNTNNINNDSIFGSINSSANVQQQQQQPHPTSQLDHHQQHHLSHNHHSHLQQQHQHSPYNGLHSRDHSFTSSSGSFPSSLSPATNGNDQNGKSMFQISDLSGNITTLNSPVTGEYNCFPNLPSFDLLRSSCLDLDGQGSSPSSSGSESDRESTSSSMTTVNERQTAHLLAAVENTDPNLVATIPGHTIIDPITGIPGKSLPTLNAPLTVPVKKVGRRGRPPKKDAKSRNRQGKGNGKLWEFIRDLLLDSATNPSLIRWERREDGVFKFVQSDKVAKLWGQRKQNPRMTYEKLSRAMRYYYKSQVLLPVFGRRLVYKFGPNATGWRAHPLGLM